MNTHLNATKKKKAGRRFRILLALLLLVLLLVAIRKPVQRHYYPLDYQDIIAAAAAEFDVPKDLVCAVIWCESRFRPEAQSAAGACGLMQLTPETFGEVLWRLDLPEDTDILSPAQNIRCGTFYLHHLYRLYGNWETVLAAYNAGMGNVNGWLSDQRYSADGETLRDIPFTETASYVKKVQAAREVYKELYPGEFT